MKPRLGHLEEMVLLVVMVVADEAYGITITEAYREQTGNKISLSAIHTVLRRLEKKGFIDSHMGGATRTEGEDENDSTRSLRPVINVWQSFMNNGFDSGKWPPNSTGLDGPKANPQNPLPPKWADRFLEWFCANDLLEEVQGDIYEMFMRRVRKQGLPSARRMFFWDVIRFFNWSTIRGKEPWSFEQPTTSMFKTM